ncbi:MAG: ATP-binding protein [Cyanobacteria bacterium P01_A01_bin.17]
MSDSQKNTSSEASSFAFKELQHFFDSSSDCCCVIDSQGYFKYLNPRWAKVLGWSLAELENHHWLDTVAQGTRATALDAYQQAQQGKRIRFQGCHQHRNGEEHWLNWQMWRGANQYIYAVVSEIAQVQASEQLNSSTTESRPFKDAYLQDFEEIQQILVDQSSVSDVKPQVLYDLSLTVCNSFNDQDLLQTILEHLTPAIPHDISGGILLTNSMSNLLANLSSEGHNAAQCKLFFKTERLLSAEVKLQIQQQLLCNLAHVSGQTLNEDQLTLHTLESEIADVEAPAIQEVGSQVFVPLIVPSDAAPAIIGLLFVGAEQKEQFTEEHVRLLYFAASHVAIAAQRFRSQVALEQLSQVIMNLQDGVLLLDKNKEIALANGRAKDYLAQLAEMGTDQTLTQLGGKSLEELMCCPTEDRNCREVTAVGHPECVFEVIVQPASLDVQLGHWVVVIRDISDRKRFELKIQNALEHARELSELKSRVMRTVSHEYRSPLTTILLAAETLEKSHGQLSNKQRHHFLERIQQTGKYMTQLVDDMLYIDKSESGQLQFNPAAIDLNVFCSKIIEELRIQGDYNHTLVLSGQDSSEKQWMDPVLLRQIVTNLLTNAIKYSPNGGCIRLSLADESEQVVLTVQDEGMGVPVSEQERIFDAFYRADNVDTIQGTGLGLCIAKKFVELHNGQICLDSKIDVGTTVTIMFPKIPVPSI